MHMRCLLMACASHQAAGKSGKLATETAKIWRRRWHQQQQQQQCSLENICRQGGQRRCDISRNVRCTCAAAALHAVGVPFEQKGRETRLSKAGLRECAHGGGGWRFWQEEDQLAGIQQEQQEQQEQHTRFILRSRQVAGSASHVTRHTSHVVRDMFSTVRNACISCHKHRSTSTSRKTCTMSKSLYKPWRLSLRVSSRIASKPE